MAVGAGAGPKVQLRFRSPARKSYRLRAAPLCNTWSLVTGQYNEGVMTHVTVGIVLIGE